MMLFQRKNSIFNLSAKILKVGQICLIAGAVFSVSACDTESESQSGSFYLEDEDGQTEVPKKAEIRYYNDLVTFDDIEGMEVHCTVIGEGKIECLDTIAEIDALHTLSTDSSSSTNERRGAGFCRFFWHRDHNGSSFRCDQGYKIPWVGDYWNDEVSSIECNSGARSIVYEHIDFGGDRKNYGTTSYVGGIWNDQISSLRVY